MYGSLILHTIRLYEHLPPPPQLVQIIEVPLYNGLLLLSVCCCLFVAVCLLYKLSYNYHAAKRFQGTLSNLTLSVFESAQSTFFSLLQLNHISIQCSLDFLTFDYLSS